jgi:hypothetical protein
MSDLLTDSTPRRGFVARLAAATAAIGAGLHGHAVGAQPPAAAAGRARTAAASEPPVVGDWDMSWVDRVKGAHRQVFDAPEVMEGMVLHQTRAWLQGYEDVYGAAGKDASAVLVVRHFGIPLVMGDALWDRYQLGQKMSAFTADKQPLKDPTTGEPARRHPYLNANVKQGDKHASMYVAMWPDSGLDSLLKRPGVTVLACNMALQFIANTVVAPQDGVSSEEALKRVKADLLPGVIVMPSGIFAVGRAEEAGCRYIYSA